MTPPTSGAAEDELLGHTRAGRTPVGVIDVGGTHVSAGVAQVDHRYLDLISRPLDSQGSAEDIVAGIVAATRGQQAPVWVVAMPGPFDYEAGVGTFDGVEKFAGLRGYPLGEVLRAQLPGLRELVFINDADAYGLGEAHRGAGMSAHRLVCLTLGTGVGSAFLERGRLSTTDVPHLGCVNYLTHRGRPLEDWMSRRALVRAWVEDGGNPAYDVAHIALRARAGDPVALGVFASAYRELAAALLPWIQDFGADRLVIGGAIARSWDLVAAYFIPHIGDIPVVPAALGAQAPLWGAAHVGWTTKCQPSVLA